MLNELLSFYGESRTYKASNGQTATAEPLVNSEKSRLEFSGFFDFMLAASNERSLGSDELKNFLSIWRDYKSKIVAESPNIAELIMIMLVLPLSNATVERHFSTMNNIHTSGRNRMHVATVDTLMMMSIEGPEVKDLDATTFLGRVLDTWNRLPHNQKYRSGA